FAQTSQAFAFAGRRISICRAAMTPEQEKADHKFRAFLCAKQPITKRGMKKTPSIAHIVASSRSGYEAQRFDLRFFRPFRADLSIRKSSSFLPPLIAARSQRGFAPRPAQVSPKGPRYFGGTFFPRNALPPPPTTLAPPTTSILSNCI